MLRSREETDPNTHRSAPLPCRKRPDGVGALGSALFVCLSKRGVPLFFVPKVYPQNDSGPIEIPENHPQKWCAQKCPRKDDSIVWLEAPCFEWAKRRRFRQTV